MLGIDVCCNVCVALEECVSIAKVHFVVLQLLDPVAFAPLSTDLQRNAAENFVDAKREY